MEAGKQLTYLTIDKALDYVGGFGRYQLLALALMIPLKFSASFQSLVIFFTAHDPSWQCVQNSTFCNLTGTYKAGDDFYSRRCEMPRDAWEYTTPKIYSVTTQFDLVCERRGLIFFLTSFYFIGWAFGSVVLGYLSDKFGRFPVMFGSSVFLLLIPFLSAFSSTYWGFAAARAFVGFFYPGQLVQMFALVNEYVSPKYRPLSGMLFFAIFTLAVIAVGVHALFIRQWKLLIIVTTAPYAVFLIMLWFIPESPRWLRVRGKCDEALKLLKRAAAINRKTFPDNVELEPVSPTAEHQKISPWLLFNTKTMLWRSLNLGFGMFVSAMVYYGITFGLPDLGGDIYRDFILSAALEIPALIVAVYCPMTIGRKKTVIIPQIFGAIICIATSIVPSKGYNHLRPLRITLGLTGKFLMTTAFNALYTWSLELYPTQIRSQGLGWLQITSRIGAASAPWVAQFLIVFHRVLPFSLMGVFALVSSLLFLYLPETKGQPTNEEIKEDKPEKKENGNELHFVCADPEKRELCLKEQNDVNG